MSDYTIVDFNNNNNSITLAFDGRRVVFPLPVENGLYPEGAALTSLLDSYVAGSRAAETPVPASNGSVITALITPPLSASLAAAIRMRRTQFLALTDWTQTKDAALTSAQVTAWETYRTNLRNVPQQPGFPTTITWPVPPTPVTTIAGVVLTNTDGTPSLPLTFN